MSKKKRFTTTTLAKILMFLFFAGLGLFSVAYEIIHYNNITLTFYLYTMAIIFVSIPIHVLLHEVGHLLAGLLSGYEFIMFRLFSFLWIKTDEGLSRRKQHIPGVLGQALMVPPTNSQTERPPFLLYHLGGLILNGLTAILFVLVGKNLVDPFPRYFFYLSAVIAVFLLITNLLPFKGTDGYNIHNYFKNPNQEDEILTLLYLYRDMVKGLPYSEIQASSQLDDIPDFKNPNTVTLYSLQAAAAFEQYDFEKAREIYALLWKKLDQLLAPHKTEISMNYLFTLFLTDPAHPHVARIRKSPYYKAYRKVKQADSYRVFAAEALYLDEDYAKAAELLAKGEKEIPFAPTVSDENVEILLYQYLQKALDFKINETT